MGFSEHIILHNIEGHPYTFIKSGYLQNFLNLKANAEVLVELGAEVDFIPKFTEKIGNFLGEFPFDYVIGAVHFIDNWSIDSPLQMHEYSKRNIKKVYEEYFSLVKRLCQYRLFDILAHPDLIKFLGSNQKPIFPLFLKKLLKQWQSTTFVPKSHQRIKKTMPRDLSQRTIFENITQPQCSNSFWLRRPLTK
jgi:HisJ family histidinol phosphate phosphatase